MRLDFLPKGDDRALIVGSTGSGKSQFGKFILRRGPHFLTIILDTKEEETFRELPKATFATSEEEIEKKAKLNEFNYIIYRPSIHIVRDPMLLDATLYWIYERFRNTTIFIDEVYQVHKNRIAGPGLIALLTRGRSRGLQTIMCSQRPAGLSMFCLTEAQRFYIFNLTDRRDRVRLGDVIPDFGDSKVLPKFYFYYYKAGADRYFTVAPIKPDLIQSVKPEDRTAINTVTNGRGKEINWQ